MAKPKTKPDAAEPTPAANSIPTLPLGAHDLASLADALGKPDESARRLLFRNRNQEALYQWGVQADSGNILADIPRFVSSSVRILAGLDEDRRGLVMLPPQIFGVLVSEARALEEMHRGHQTVSTSETGDKEDREVVLKRLSAQGVALRNRVLGSLRSAMGDDRTAKVRSTANDASSPDSLVNGMEAVAGFIEETLKDGAPDDEAALDAFSVGAARAAEIRKKAAEIRAKSTITAATEKRVSQRALDIQDGRVLVLVDIVYRAFRLARRSDKSILLPELNRLASLFGAGSGGPATKGGPPDESSGGTSGGTP